MYRLQSFTKLLVKEMRRKRRNTVKVFGAAILTLLLSYKSRDSEDFTHLKTSTAQK